MKTIFKIIDRLEEIGMVIGMTIMVIVNFANVVSRYLFPKNPFSFTEELTVMLFVWMTMLGIACGYRRFSHTGLSLFTDMMPEKGQKFFIVFSTLCSAVFMIVLVVTGFTMVQGQIKHGQIMPALKIPEAVAGFSIPIGGIMILIRALQAGYLQLKHFGEKSVEGDINI